MLSLSKIKDHTLRRLYKFILKRVLGQYLESELLLEQLEVQSRTGNVSLKNLRLDCDLLNEYLSASPLRVVEAEVGELQASISYDAILCDGCNVTCRGLVVVLAPAISMSTKSKNSRKTSQANYHNKQHVGTDRTAGESNTESGKCPHVLGKDKSSSGGGGFCSEEDNVSDDSLGFIAQWIEVIIARLRVTVEDFHVILLDSTSIESSSTAVHVKFKDFIFYNSHPRLMQESGSSVLATSMMGGGSDQSSSFIDAMNTRKLITLESLSVGIIISEVSSPVAAPAAHVDSLDAYISSLINRRDDDDDAAVGRGQSSVVDSDESDDDDEYRKIPGTPGSTSSFPPQTQPAAALHPILQLGPHGKMEIQLSSTNGLAFGSVDIDMSFPKLTCDVRSSALPHIMQVITPYMEYRQTDPINRATASPDAASYQPVSALDFSNIGSDVIRLEEGLRQLQMNKTMSALDRMQRDISEGIDSGEEELNFGRLTHLMKQYQITREKLAKGNQTHVGRRPPHASMTASHTTHASHYIDDSDIEFPSGSESSSIVGFEDNDDDDSDFEFHDAQEGGTSLAGTCMREDMTAAMASIESGRQHHHHRSAMEESLYGATSVMESQMFHSTKTAGAKASTSSHQTILGDATSTHKSQSHTMSLSRAKPDLGCYFRLYIESVALVVKDDRLSYVTTDEIVLKLGSAVVSIAIPADPPIGSSTAVITHPPVISATFSSITLCERVYSRSKQPRPSTNSAAREHGGADNDDADEATPPSSATDEEPPQHDERIILTFSSRAPDQGSLIIPDESVGFTAAMPNATGTKEQKTSEGVMLLSGPLLEITATLKSFEDGGTVVNVDFEHAKGEFSIAMLSKWASILDEVTMPQTSTSSPFVFACNLTVKSIEAILLVDDTNDPTSDICALLGYAGPNWSKITTGLGFGAASNWSNHRWKKVKTDHMKNQVLHSSNLTSSYASGKSSGGINDVPGSLRLVASGVVVTISSTNVSSSPADIISAKQRSSKASTSHTVPTCTTTSTTSLKVENINCFLRLSRSRSISVPNVSTPVRMVDTWELGFLRILSDGKNKKISVGKAVYTGPEGLDGSAEGQQDSMGNDERFIMPTLNLSEILNVKAHIVRADLRQLENVALIAVVRALSPSTACPNTFAHMHSDGDEDDDDDMIQHSSSSPMCTGTAADGDKIWASCSSVDEGGPGGGGVHSSPSAKTQTSLKRSASGLSSSSVPQASAFGIRVSSHILTLRISQDVGVDCDISPSFAMPNTKENGGDCSSEPGSHGPLCYTLSVKDPLVEVYTATNPVDGFRQYIGLMASDVSLYEMSSSQAEAGGGRAETCRGARFFDSTLSSAHTDGLHRMYDIPFIHRTSLETSWMTENLGLATPAPHSGASSTRVGASSIVGNMSKSALVDMTSVHSRSKHRALGVRVLIAEEPNQLNSSPGKGGFLSNRTASQVISLKSTHIHISLRDMTYRFDALSRWFNRIPELFTTGNSDIHDTSEYRSDESTTVTEFAKTRISISVQKLLVDFCQPKLTAYDGAESRLLLSIGKLQLSSTLVSNSPRVGLKFSMNDMSVRIGNHLLRNDLLEQSPIDADGRYIEEYHVAEDMDGIMPIHGGNHSSHTLPLDLDSFLDAHGIVTMGNIDHLECRLDLNSAYRGPGQSSAQSGDVDGGNKCVAMSFEATAGTCFFYGCADSLHLLTDTLSSLSEHIHTDTDDTAAVITDQKDPCISSYTSGDGFPARQSRGNRPLTPSRSGKRDAPHVGSTLTNKLHCDLVAVSESKSTNETARIKPSPTSIDSKPKVTPSTRPKLTPKHPPLSSDFLGDVLTTTSSKSASGSSTLRSEGSIAGHVVPPNWMATITQDTFKPRTQNHSPSGVAPAIAPIHGENYSHHHHHQQQQLSRYDDDADDDALSAVTGNAMDMSGMQHGGLNMAVIEDFYREPTRELESPEFEARYYAHYDYYDDDEDDNALDDMTQGSMGQSGIVDMSGFVAMEESQPALILDEEDIASVATSGRFGTQYSSDGEDDDEFGGMDQPVASNMWTSWGALKTIKSTRPTRSPSLEDMELPDLDHTGRRVAADVHLSSSSSSMSANNRHSGSVSSGCLDLTKTLTEIAGGHVAGPEFTARPSLNTGDSDYSDDPDHLHDDYDSSPSPPPPSQTSQPPPPSGSPPALTRKRSSTVESFDMSHSYHSSDDGHDGVYDNDTIESGNVSVITANHSQGIAATGPDIMSCAMEESTILYPTINYADSSVILDPRQDMMVVAEGPIDEDMQRAWLATLEDGNTSGGALDREQRAGWYDSNASIPAKIIPHHIPVPAMEDVDAMPEEVEAPNVAIIVRFNLRVRLFGGREWSSRRKQSFTATRTATTADLQANGKRAEMAYDDETKQSQSTAGGSTAAAVTSALAPAKSGGNKSASGVKKSVLFRDDTKSGSNRSYRNYKRNIKQHLPPPSAQSGTRRQGTKLIGGVNVGRDSADATEISLRSIVVHCRMYPHHDGHDHTTPGDAHSGPQLLPVRRFVVKVHDLLVSHAPVGRKEKKILGYWKNYQKPVESNKPLLELAVAGYDVHTASSLHARGSDHTGDVEYRLQLTILPLRCYLDGRYVDFVKSFILGVSSVTSTKASAPVSTPAGDGVKASTDDQPSSAARQHQSVVAPSMRSDSIGRGKGGVIAPSLGGVSIPDGSLESDFSADYDGRHEGPNDDGDSNTAEPTVPSEPIREELHGIIPDGSATATPVVMCGMYFQSWIVNVVDIKIDYSPKQINVESLFQGDYIQLLNLFSIDGLEITFKKVALVGVSGIASGLNKTLEEWVNEIYANRMDRLLRLTSSASPLRGLSTIGSSLQGLLLIPVQEYKSKGAAGVLKALQKQSASVVKAITRETLNASYQVSQFIAGALVDLVAPDSARNSMDIPMRHRNQAGRGQDSATERQPRGFVDSLDRAYDAVSREIHSTLDTVVVMPVRQFQRSGPGGALRSVIRAIPVAVLRPTAGAAEALSYTLLGLRNNVDPNARRDEEDMWNVDHSSMSARNREL